MRDDNFNAIEAIDEAAPAQLPAQPSEDRFLGIVPPDKPAVSAETSDTTLKHAVCQQDIRVPQFAVDELKRGGRLFCPACRSEFTGESWSFADTSRAVVGG